MGWKSVVRETSFLATFLAVWFTNDKADRIGIRGGESVLYFSGKNLNNILWFLVLIWPRKEKRRNPILQPGNEVGRKLRTVVNREGRLVRELARRLPSSPE